MRGFKKWIVPAVVCAFLFAAGSVWAAGNAELNLYRTLKRYVTEYGADSLSNAEVGSLKKTASKNATDSLRLGLWYYQNKQYDDVFPAISRAADRNNPDGILLKGVCYLAEIGTKEKSKGAAFIKSSARGGHPVAQYLLGSMYEEGYGGVARNAEEAKIWYASAAKLGMNADALSASAKFGSVLANWRSGAAIAVKPSDSNADAGSKSPAPSSASGPASTPTAPETPGKNPVMNRVWYKAGSKMPDPAGLSLASLQDAWDRIRSVTKIDAWLIYDDKDELNAYMTKNDKGEIMVVVYRGLMKIFRTEDELAGVLGHESGHAVLGHLEKGRNQQIGVSVAASILSNLLGNSIADVAIGAGAQLASSGYSREAEVQADDYGTECAAKAGFSPFSLYDAVKRMADAGAVTPPSGFNSHPPTERRMQRLKDKAEYWQKKLAEGKK